MNATNTIDAEPLGPVRGRLTLVFLAVIATGLGVSALARPSDTAAPTPGMMAGTPAPEVAVDLFTGGTWKLSDHVSSDGRPVVLNLWASWCLPCRDEIPELSTFATANPEIAVVGVSVDKDIGEAIALIDELTPGYPVGIDATGTVLDRYPTFGLPFTVVIDGSGTIRHELLGGITAARLSELFD